MAIRSSDWFCSSTFYSTECNFTAHLVDSHGLHLLYFEYKYFVSLRNLCLLRLLHEMIINFEHGGYPNTYIQLRYDFEYFSATRKAASQFLHFMSLSKRSHRLYHKEIQHTFPWHIELANVFNERSISFNDTVNSGTVCRLCRSHCIEHRSAWERTGSLTFFPPFIPDISGIYIVYSCHLFVLRAFPLSKHVMIMTMITCNLNSCWLRRIVLSFFGAKRTFVEPCPSIPSPASFHLFTFAHALQTRTRLWICYGLSAIRVCIE